MFKRYKKYLVHFEVEPPGVAALLRRKPQHGKFAKYTANIEKSFLTLSKTIKFCSHIYKTYSSMKKKYYGTPPTVCIALWVINKDYQMTPEQIMKYGKKYKEAFPGT